MHALRRNGAVYFALQGIAVLLWWFLLFWKPELRGYFSVPGAPPAVLLAFCLPDLMLVTASFTASLLCLRGGTAGSTARTPVLWLLAGGWSYAWLYCLTLSMLTNSAWLGTALMTPPALFNVIFALALSSGRQLLRQARPAGRRWNIVKTLLQIVLIWSTFLLILPWLLLKFGPPLTNLRFQCPGQQPAALLLFLACSTLGLSSGMVMASRGKGTPLPLDSPRRLVLQGPYAYVRNPMAIAGLGQGAAVALWTGSLVLGVYVLLGGLIWQFIARPLEEEDLRHHFGDAYHLYSRQVQCWWPRLTPFHGALSSCPDTVPQR